MYSLFPKGTITDILLASIKFYSLAESHNPLLGDWEYGCRVCAKVSVRIETLIIMFSLLVLICKSNTYVCFVFFSVSSVIVPSDQGMFRIAHNCNISKYVPWHL